eukprot:COSAG01_NODE_3870_length_5605_cov_4.345260_12_plen_54_part_00
MIQSIATPAKFMLCMVRASREPLLDLDGVERSRRVARPACWAGVDGGSEAAGK